MILLSIKESKMKNVTMNINNNAIQSLGPPTQLINQPAPLIQEYAVSFTARFENEDEAIAFAKFVLNDIEVFKKGDR